ncbi:tyrosine-type recombinase/integrase [Acetobacter conturbans]|uniref:Tyrosine-type recombinase/integrase n=1 Tax=Acetobacter conturbans TaxID=1737472 RepID=A0ABX0K2A2_9PROT|nr:tyrosine-type recombinase/integrase [Acetobacter conturbans]NHN89867.1 tyrosine-type recombinase/integrase [Acetobacter conturbans]
MAPASLSRPRDSFAFETAGLLASHPPASISPRIVETLKRYATHARGAFSEQTIRAIRSDTRIFFDWCGVSNITPLPATPEAVAGFVDAMAAEGKAPATIRRYIASIGHLHIAADLETPTHKQIVRLALSRHARQRGTEQAQALGATRRYIDLILHIPGSSLLMARDKALIATAYDTMARRSELVAIRKSDLQFNADGDAVIRIRRSKTDQEGEGTFRYVAPDTAALLKEWIARAGLGDGTGDAPLFRSVRKGGRQIGEGLSPYDVTRIIKRLAQQAGFAPDITARLSSHSPRIGATQDMEAYDISMAGIMLAAGWKSPTMVARYTRQQAAARSGAARLAQRQNRV